MHNIRIVKARTKRNRHRRRRRVVNQPTLRFSPHAWAKLTYLRDKGETEVGGFGITPPDDLLLLEDIVLIRQDCTPVSVRFDDSAVADYFDEQVDSSRRPEQFARIWIHTHPGNSANPSFVDEETFARVFGPSDWALMFILARGGQTYARLRFNAGPGGAMVIPVGIDYSRRFAGSNLSAWADEYAAAVRDEATFWSEDGGRVGERKWPASIVESLREIIRERKASSGPAFPQVATADNPQSTGEASL